MNTQEYIEAVKKYRNELHIFATRYTADSDSAADAVQDALVTLWLHHEEVAFSHAKGYLVRVLYRLLVDNHRHAQRFEQKKDYLMPDEAYCPHDHYELHDTMQQALAKLPDLQRAALLMKDIEGYQYKEIAKIMELDEMQVAGLLYRARINLKKQILKLEQPN